MKTPRLDTWEKEYDGLESFCRDPKRTDGLLCTSESHHASIKAFIRDLLAAQDRASREDEREKIRIRIQQEEIRESLCVCKVENWNPNYPARCHWCRKVDSLLPVEDLTPSHEA